MYLLHELKEVRVRSSGAVLLAMEQSSYLVAVSSVSIMCTATLVSTPTLAES